ncbi:MAG: ABC transporter ATP-binding protein [Acidobacteriota bacterium]
MWKSRVKESPSVAFDVDAGSALVRITSVEKSIPFQGGSLFLLRSINLEITPGEFISVMGPSGAGKSTLLHILGMFDDGWSGEYWLDGTAVHALSSRARLELRKRNVGFVFQSYHLLDDLTVYENLETPLTYRDMKRSEKEALVAETLDRFRIVGKQKLYPSQLSGGQQQLVAIARAVIASPRLILADEPTGNLHSDQAREIMELFRSLNEAGTTIVQVTHSEENAAYGRRVIRLSDGRMVDG